LMTTPFGLTNNVLTILSQAFFVIAVIWCKKEQE
jgi:hypothetical protein